MIQKIINFDDVVKKHKTASQLANVGPHVSRGRTPAASLGRLLKILFDSPGDVLK